MVRCSASPQTQLGRIPRLLLMAMFCLSFLPVSLSAAVSAQLSAQDIDELESVILTIRAGDTRQTEALDLSALEPDFEVLNTNTSSNYRFVNGREQSWVDYQITLQPKRVGELTIPGITIGRDTTPSMSLRVRRLSTQMRDVIERKVFFETEVSATSIYVQAELILTRSLFYSQGVQLYSDLPGPPEIDDAVVLTLGETTSSKTTRAGEPYGVIQQRYAIFPEASGSFTIPSVNITASVRLNENGRFSRKGVRVATDEVEIEIKPVPATYPTDQPWLPAADVSVLQKLSGGDSVAVGDTLTHEFLIQVIGNVGSLAPPKELELATDAYRKYPQAPVINDDTNGAQVVGARLQTTSVVPLIPGDLSIPAQVVYWWNTSTDSLEQAVTDTISFTATGTAVNQTPTTTQQEPETPTTTATDSPAPFDLEAYLTDSSKRKPLLLIVVSLLLALGIYQQRTRLGQYLQRLKQARPTSRLTALKQAKSNSDFYAAVLAALHANRSDRPGFSLADLERLAPETAAPLARLRNVMYSPAASNTNDNSCVLSSQERRVVMRAIQELTDPGPQTPKQTTLPPLYPAR